MYINDITRRGNKDHFPEIKDTSNHNSKTHKHTNRVTISLCSLVMNSPCRTLYALTLLVTLVNFLCLLLTERIVSL